MVISIDWLQLNLSGVFEGATDFKCTLQPYTTKVFRKVYTIEHNGDEWGVLVTEPISPILDCNMCILKLNNRILYSDTLFSSLDWFLKSSRLAYKGITRLDIAADFNTFHNNLNPHNLISKFFKLDYRYVGRSTFKAIGKQTKYLSFDYLRFGTSNSPVSAYLYNKTKELQEAKMKSWIVETWKKNGLDVNKTVWRLEFSIKGNYLKLNDKQTGELLDLDINTIRSADFMKNVYYALQSKYFHFKRNTGIKNVTEMPELQLLPTFLSYYERIHISGCGDGGRSDKIFIKKLENLNCELRTTRQDIRDAQELLLDFVVSEKGLEQFYDKKIHGILTERNVRRKQAVAEFCEAVRASKKLKWEKAIKVYKQAPERATATNINYSQLKLSL